MRGWMIFCYFFSAFFLLNQCLEMVIPIQTLLTKFCFGPARAGSKVECWALLSWLPVLFYGKAEASLSARIQFSLKRSRDPGYGTSPSGRHGRPIWHGRKTASCTGDTIHAGYRTKFNNQMQKYDKTPHDDRAVFMMLWRRWEQEGRLFDGIPRRELFESLNHYTKITENGSPITLFDNFCSIQDFMPHARLVAMIFILFALARAVVVKLLA